MKKLLGVLTILLLAASFSYAQVTSVPTTTLNVTVGTEAAIVVGSTSTFTAGSGSFANWTASTPFTYYIRTTTSGGSGNIQLKITSDFSPSGGPSVANSGSTGDTLTYTCSVQSPGSACSGTQTASTSTPTPVATFGAAATSAKGGNASNSVAWTLVNDPAYAQGSYVATATFTISAS